jgi:hypothetical protein
MESLKIVLLSVLAAVVYGILHDQVTARICVEYFTVGHARLIESESPTVLGLFWGVVATWWVGLPLGVGLAFFARIGSRPKLGAGELLRPLVRLLAVMYGIAILAGLIGYFGGKAGKFWVLEPIAGRIAPGQHVPFLICAWAHGAAYLAGFFGGITLWILTWRRRGKLPAEIPC